MAKKPTIGAGIALDGEKEFRQAVSAINQDIKVMASEMDKVSASFEGNANSLEALTAKQDVLGRQLLNERDKVEALKAALKNSANEFGEADKRTKSWQISLNKAEAELTKTKNALNKTTKEIDDFGKSADKAGKSTSFLADIFTGSFLGNLASDALSTTVNYMQQFATAAFNLADELTSMSDVTGRSVEELQKLKYIGDDVGASLDIFAASQSRLTKNMSEAQQGTDAQALAFAQLGVHYLNADGSLRNVTNVMYEAFDALGKMTNETERDALAMELFGKSATDLNPLIKAGADELKRLGDEAKNSGAVMSAEAVQGLDAMGDAFAHVQQKATALIGELVGGLIPNMKTVGELNADVAKNEEISTLIERYRTLKDRLNDNTLSSEELRAVSQELATVKLLLIDLSDGMIDAYGEENGTIEDQIEKYAEMTDAEKKLAEAQLLSKASQYDSSSLERREEILNKLSEATNKYTDANILYIEQQTDLDSMIRNFAPAMDLDIQVQAMEITKGKVSDLKKEVDTLKAQLDVFGTSSEEAADAMQGLFDIGWSTRDIADELGISLGEVYSVMNNVASVAERATQQMQNFATAAKNASVTVSPNVSAAGSNQQSVSQTSSGGQPLNIQPGTVVINLDGKQIANATYPYTLEQSSLKGTNLIK